MSTGSLPEKRTVYFGPVRGIYEPTKFDDFMRNSLVAKLWAIENPSACNDEPIGLSEVTYHFPQAGLGVNYSRVRENRCLVTLLSTRKEVIDKITEFIFEEDSK